MGKQGKDGWREEITEERRRKQERTRGMVLVDESTHLHHTNAMK